MPSSIYTGLDESTSTELEIKQRLEDASKGQASILNNQAAFKAWLDHPITQTKIRKLKEQKDKQISDAMHLSVEYEKNQSKIHSCLNLAQAAAWMLDLINKESI